MTATITSQTNVSCNGGSNGSLTVTQSGGTSTFDYAWSNGSTTSSTGSSINTISSCTASTYTVTVTDNNSCTATASATITQPSSPLNASASVSSALDCNGDTDGQVTASPSGGTSPYTYSWSTGGTSATETNLGSGTYSVTITDQNTCTDSASVTLTQPTALVASASVSSTLDCNGDTDGQVTASPSGGSSPYTYSWSTGGTSATETNLGAGTYSVTITDQNNCTDSASVTLTQPTALVASASVSSTLDCNGDTDGQVTASPSGGSSPYTYSWSTGGTSATETGLGAGTYSVTITDQNNCTDSASVTLTQPTALVASASVSSLLDCNGDTDGQVTASASGGSSPFTYSWNTGGTSATETGLGAGTYSVTITDQNNCTDSGSVTLTQPTALVASASVDSNASCAGGDGGGTASASGGTGSYTYTWSNGATTASITGINAGTYSVTITDANGCTDSASVTINGVNGPSASVSVDSNATCNGYSNGGVTVSAVGGTGSYTYSWSNSATTASITGIVAGTYTVTVTDAGGCTDVASNTVTEPAVLVASMSVDSNISCNGSSDGGATASATGGTMSYTYSWSNGATTASVTGIAAGTYSVTITDQNGCTDSASVTISEPATLSASASLDNNISCVGVSDGGATANPSGGTATFTYLWSNGVTNASITNASAGTYSVTITDANGCTDSASISFTDPSPYLVSIDQGDSTEFCGGDSVLLSSVSTANSYSWNLMDQGNWALVGTAGFSATSFSNLDLKFDNSGTPYVAHNIGNGLVSVEKYNGTNWVSVGASTFGIESTSSSSFAFDIDGNTPYVAYAGHFSGKLTVQKFDGTNWVTVGSSQFTNSTALYVDLKVSSGVPYVTFRDDYNGSKASVMKFDGSNWVYIGTAGFSASNCALNAIDVYNDTVFVAYQDFSVSQKATVKKYNGSSWVTVGSAGFSPYPAIYIDLDVDNGTPHIAFANGFGVPTSAVMKYSGGSWSQIGSGSASAGFANFMSLSAQNDELYIGYQDGSNSNKATVRKFNGTSWVDHGAAGFSAGTVQLTSLEVYNNVPYLAFQDGSNSGKATVMNLEPSLTQVGTSNTYYADTAGTYILEATSAAGCTAYDTIVVSELLGLGITATSDSNVSCNGQSDGGATASVSTGTAPYTYSWSNSATTASITGIVAGTYSVTVTDANGCTDSTSVTITEPAILVATSVADSNASCNGYSDGGATASATGGTPSYTYSWSNSATTASITGMVAGTYSVTITDQNGCTDSASVTITEPAALAASSVVDSNISCNGGSDGGASASATGGTPAYTYSWSNGATTASVTGIAAGTYSVTITDANGCTDSASITLTEPSALTVVANIDSLSAASATASGGTTAYTYAWSNGATTSAQTGLAPGTYTVTVTDANGCNGTDAVTIPVPTGFTQSATSGCIPLSVTFTDTSSNVTSRTWDFGNGETSTAISYNATYSSVGSFTVQLINTYSYGLVDTLIVSNAVTVNPPKAAFSLNPQFGCATPHTVFFTDGSTLPDTWNWNFGDAGTSTAQNPIHTYSTAGTFSVRLIVTDTVFGCADTAYDTVIVSVLSASASVDSNVSCNGLSDGGLTATPINNVGSPTYSWNNGATTQSITAVPAGTYTVTVTDVNGCTSTASSSVTQPSLLVASTVVDSNETCLNANNGGLTASASGGTLGYTYSWSNSATTASITGVSAGNYSVTITDANGCTDSASSAVVISSTFALSVSVGSNVSCNGGNDGSLTANPTSGSSPYSYAWSNSGSSASITGITAGTYSVTVTDNDGCTVVDSNSVTEPSVLVASAGLNNNVSCNSGSDGSISATATGGTGSYTYSWSNGGTSSTQTGLTAGTYSVTITDANGCTDSASINVSEPALLVALASLNNNVSCNGLSDGAITATASGGTTSYTYSWSNGATTSSNSGLVAGTYSVTITDANGCTDSASMTVTEPNVLVATASLDSNANCYASADGGVSASAIGGTTAYTYSWSNSVTTSINANIPSGTYSVTITDANGCTDSASAVVGVFDDVNPVAITQNISIQLDANGQATIAVIDIDNGSYDNCGINSMSLDITNFDCSDVGANTVTLTVQDTTGNTVSATATVTVADTVTPIIVGCLPDQVVAASASCDYTLPDYTVGMTFTDSCGIASIVQTPSSGSVLGTGTTLISIVVTDVNANTKECTFNVTVNDSTAPEISCISDMIVSNDVGFCGATVTFANPTASDNCGVDTIMQIAGLPSGSFFPVDTTVMTYVAIDSTGNSDTCHFMIIVNDDELPTIDCINDTAVCQETFTFATPVGFDNCTVISVVQTAGLPSGSVFPIGNTVNTFTVTDSSGNQNTCSFTLTRDEVPSIADAGADQVLCDTVTSILTGAQPAVGNGIWTSLGSATVASINQNISAVNGLEIGVNAFVWTVGNGVCPMTSDTVTIQIDDSPTVADAGIDQDLCDTTSYQFAANTPAVGAGVWTTVSGAAINDTNASNALVSNLPQALSTFTWTITNGVCPPSTDDVVLNVGTTPVVDAGDDLFTQGTVDKVPVIVTINQPTTVTWEPASLIDDPSAESTFAYIDETTQFIITAITDAGCLATDTLNISVLSAIEVSTAFTPDGDGFNDEWNIEGSEFYPKMKVMIFNRWGGLVFESNEGYTVKFDGKFNGKLLPVSSYYYIIEFNDGVTEPRDGNLTIIY
ncbi:MAG: HYR domain-containing protein [Flavobacteriales bacterium]